MSSKLNFLSAYHPQTDGQSEIANSIVLNLLKSYVGEVAQSNQWEKYLPLVEYAYNNTIHTSTGKTPFEVIEGRPRLPLILKPHEKIFAADEEVQDIRVAKIKESIQYAQQKYKRAADKHRKSLQFKDGDWVLLRFTKAWLKTTTGKNWKGEQTDHQKYYMKLAKRYYGPFQILSRINETAYKLRLPANWHIHNAFHVSLLKPFKGDPPKEPVQEEPPLFDDIEEVLQPKEILRHEENILRSGNEPESLRDEPVDAELFKTSAIAVEEIDPKWMEVQEFLQSGKIPKDWSNSRKKGLIVKSLKFTLIGGSPYRLGIDGVLRRCVAINARM
ncbi:hypothetical protein L7F22_013074 [Adiantum nelumboides]|nr:hypothetical protein [Adiantum nelumboides]